MQAPHVSDLVIGCNSLSKSVRMIKYYKSFFFLGICGWRIEEKRNEPILVLNLIELFYEFRPLFCSFAKTQSAGRSRNGDIERGPESAGKCHY